MKKLFYSVAIIAGLGIGYFTGVENVEARPGGPVYSETKTHYGQLKDVHDSHLDMKIKKCCKDGDLEICAYTVTTTISIKNGMFVINAKAN
ncbi:MAG: hypothetical protein ACEPOV_01430 [Hyphomicrobiales bacterium]